MSNTIEIYGAKIVLPSYDGVVEDWGTSDPSEQVWRKKGLPYFFKNVEYDKEGNALLNQQQRDFALEEVRRCKEGFWFMLNGVATYITGKNYFYLAWWKLEDDIYPDYRDLDRRYFLYLNHWEKIGWCLGILIGKKRRQGATSIATANLIYECIFFKNSFCGLTSKTLIDAKAAFTDMVSFGYRQLPVFLKPKQLNNKDSVSELVFAHKSVDIKGGVGGAVDNDAGHRSKIDYRAPGPNVYDSGRKSRILIDEGSKLSKEVLFSKLIAIISKTLVKGGRRVGFMECPSTTNAMTEGGAEFKIVWESANQFKHERTPNRLVKYITPAFDGYVGFIGKFGESIIDAPTDEQYAWLCETFNDDGDITLEDLKLGAKQYLINRRAQLEGAALEEEIRMNPFDEKEMFQSAITHCVYNAYKLNQQLDWLSYQDGLIERGNLVWEGGHQYYHHIEREGGEKELRIGKLLWVANPNGKYEKVVGWMPKHSNDVYEKNGYFYPNSNYALRIGCDPFKYDKTKDSRKSNCAAYVYQMLDISDAENPYNEMFVMRYVDRAPTSDIQYDHVLKMAWFCGCQVLFERNVDGSKKYFKVEKCSGFLTWLPGEVEPGIYTDGHGNAVQQICDLTESYIEKNLEKVYFKELIGEDSGWLGFKVEDTQKFDDAMSSGITLIAASAKKYGIQTDKKGVDINNLMPYRQAV